LDFITQIKQKLAQTDPMSTHNTNTNNTTATSTTALLKNSRKNELNDGTTMNQNQSDNQQSVSNEDGGGFNINDHLARARNSLNQADVGPIGALITQNEDIVDELALYSDEEDDPNLVVFDEINHNVQHYVQAASTRDSLDIISRLFDDIGGRFVYAKEQVKMHNYKTLNDPRYEQYGVAELANPKPPKIMVFCETARYAQYLASLFRQVIQLDQDNAFEAILEIHSKKGQNYRTRVAQQFSSQNWNAGCILFSSDVAARGLDTQDVDCVIQLGLPPSRQQWVHRVGRVARDGDQSGLSLTILAPQHAAQFSRMTSGLPIHVPKVGALGLGLKQDTFNNSIIDPLEQKKLGYSPMVPSQFGQVGEYFDENGPGLLSGQLRIEGALHGDMDEIKKIVAGETKEVSLLPGGVGAGTPITTHSKTAKPQPHTVPHQRDTNDEPSYHHSQPQTPPLEQDQQPLSVFEVINPVQTRNRKAIRVLPKQEPTHNPEDNGDEFDDGSGENQQQPTPPQNVSYMSLFDELRQDNGDEYDTNANDFYYNREHYGTRNKLDLQRQQLEQQQRKVKTQHHDHDSDAFNPDFDADEENYSDNYTKGEDENA
jgi:superfamily II DNA/RNA helicase